MQLVERHLIRKDDPRFAIIDAAAFASKNLYNQANYQIRQSFIHADINGSWNILRKSNSDLLQEIGRASCRERV